MTLIIMIKYNLYGQISNIFVIFVLKINKFALVIKEIFIFIKRLKTTFNFLFSNRGNGELKKLK